MRPFRSRLIAALVMAVLLLGIAASVAEAYSADDVTLSFPDDPQPPTFSN
jgi:hypothetical protein